jgi:acetyltransferase
VACYGIPVPPWRVATGAEETAAAVEALAAPAALKLVARGVVHKSDVGGVLLGIRGAAAARDGWARLMDAAARAGATGARVLVTPMLDPGVEAVVGVLRDRQFGPVVMFGLGGVLVEALDDVVFRVAPFGAGEAETMIAEIHGYRLFGAVRGRPAVDRASLVDLLVRVSELASDRPELAELDLNPVICSARGAALADARAVVG